MYEKFLVRFLVAAVYSIVLTLPITASEPYSFGDWARDNGYLAGDAMPFSVDAHNSAIDNLEGINEYDWISARTNKLDLQGNKISSIELGAFNGLPFLCNLNLKNNHISSIESGDFSGLTLLMQLYLQSNSISNIDEDAFSGPKNLKELYLNKNQISSIKTGAFNGLNRLLVLDLSSNLMSSIESVDFKGLEMLSWLYLDSNQISNIESSNFSELKNLQKLDLGSNLITSIESDDFSGLANLKYLYLRHNHLANIEPGSFSELKNLKLLSLSDNRLSHIESGAFSGLANLRVLWLGGNPDLTELNLAKANFSSLSEFDLVGNVNIRSVSLKDAVINQSSFSELFSGSRTSIGDIDGITTMDLSGIDFVNITDLSPLYVMDDLTDLWLVDTLNLDALQLDLMLDNLATIESPDIEGILYMTKADYDAFNTAGGGLLAAWDAELGHHVQIIPEPASFVLFIIFVALAHARCRMNRN